jgi:hypothetical protein
VGFDLILATREGGKESTIVSSDSAAVAPLVAEMGVLTLASRDVESLESNNIES